MLTTARKGSPMAAYPSMNGRYFSTAWNDIKNSEGWIGKIFLLGLINFIPVFGQMTVYGYAFEWGHKAAWGMHTPLPKKIYGRKNSKMLRWGWFALVILFVCTVIPAIVTGIGNAISDSSTAAQTAAMYAHHYHASMASGNVLLGALGGVIAFVGFVLSIAAVFFFWVGTMRMMIYDRLGTGVQFGKVWSMIKHDFGGLLRIFGMSIVCFVVYFIVFAIVVAIVGAGVIGTLFVGAAAGSGMYGMDNEAALGFILMALVSALPLVIVLYYLSSVAEAFIQLLVSRALGYWTRQFDVASWGKKDDPLPFERAQEPGYAAADAEPQQPAASADDGEPVAQPQPEAPDEPEAPAQPGDEGPAAAPEQPEAPSDEASGQDGAAKAAPQDGEGPKPQQ